MALARNAELNPPALGAAGAASSFLGGSSVLGSSFFSSAGLPVVIAGGAKLNPPAAGLLSDVAAADEADPPKLNPAEPPAEPGKLNAGFEDAAADEEAPRPKAGVPLADDAAADDAGAPNDGVLPAVPKPNDDDAAELAAAPPKLKAPAAPAFGAAGSSAGPFPAALSRSSWRAFCAASYPALALARNAALNPPALGAAAGLASSFLASSFFSDVVIAGGAKLNPPAAGLAAPNAGAGAAGVGWARARLQS